MIHVLVIMALFLVGGCAGASYRIQPVELAAMGAPVTVCYVHHTPESEVLDARLVGINGHWAVTGDVRTGSKPLRRRRVRVEVVNARESLVLATISPPTLGDLDRWSFHLPIPAPVNFDHLHLAVVSAEEAFFELPRHVQTHSYYLPY